MADNETAQLSYEEAYRKLLAAYLKRLGNSMDAIQTIIAQRQTGKLTRDDLQHAQHLAHGLAGSGAIFGFPDVTEAGRRADAFLTRWLHVLPLEAGKIDDDNFRELEKLMLELHKACSSAISSSSCL